MGWQLLEREKMVFEGNETGTTHFDGYEYILERQLKPEARRDIVEQLREKNIIPTAMMDISTVYRQYCGIFARKAKRLPNLRRINSYKLQAAAMAEEMNIIILPQRSTAGRLRLFFTLRWKIMKKSYSWRMFQL
jgi:thiamine-monophosphate kinase